MTAFLRLHFCSVLFVIACSTDVDRFPAIPADSTPHGRIKYQELFTTERSRIAVLLSTAEPYVISQVNAVLSLLESAESSHFYSLACLITAAESLHRSDWEHPIALHLVDQAGRTALFHTCLDEAYTEYEVYVDFLFGSPQAGWDFFIRLVAVLEWRLHSLEIRDELTNIYTRLLKTRDMDVDLVELRAALQVFVDLVKWLSPRAKPFRPDAFLPAVTRAREIVFRL